MSEVVSPGIATAGPSDHLLGRLVGVIVSPRATFERIVARPRWFGAMALVFGLLAAGQFILLSTTSGQEAMVDQQIRQAEQWSGSVNDQQVAMYERMGPYNRFIVGGTTLVFGPVVSFIVAGILLGVFTAVLGGSATYKQVLAVTSHSGATTLLGAVFTLPLNYLRGSMSSATNLGVFAQAFLDDTSFFARFFGMIDLFIIWSVIVTAIGLAVLYRRKTAPIFWSLMGVYVAIAIVIAGVMRGLSGGA
jgi:hypothetical protein